MRTYDEQTLMELLPLPQVDANKYSRGRFVLIAGCHLYPGAAVLAAVASQRIGAGYTEVYADDTVVSEVRSGHPSLVVRPWSAWDSVQFQPCTDQRPCAYTIGCGFDAQDPSASAMMRRLLHHCTAPVLVDGGALRMLSAKKVRGLCERRFKHGWPTVITPHMGEAQGLADIFHLPMDDPSDLSLRLSRAYGVVTVLKGPDSYISDGDEVYAMREGTSVLAKAGTGDALAGVIGGLLAQGLDPVDACVLGTTIHARAGVAAAADLSSVSVCAEDVVRYLPSVCASIERERRSA